MIIYGVSRWYITPMSAVECLAALWSSALVKNKDTSDEALAEFEYLLNSAQPTKQPEITVAALVSDLMNDPENLYSVILNAPRSTQHIILYTGALYITRYFKLMYVVHLRHTRDGAYQVKKYDKSAARPAARRLTRASQAPTLPVRTTPDASHFNAIRPTRPPIKHTMRKDAREFIPLRILKQTVGGVFMEESGNDAVF